MARVLRTPLAAVAVFLIGMPLAAQQPAQPPRPVPTGPAVVPAATPPVSPARPVSAGPAVVPAAASIAPTVPPAAPAAPAIAGMVNGQPIMEVDIQRSLDRIPPLRHAEVRPEVINTLVENLLVDQYLLQLNIQIDKKEIDAQIDKIKLEIAKDGKKYEEELQKLRVTEEDLRKHIAALLRWDKFCLGQGDDKVLHKFFDENLDRFDGSTVRARHILLTPASADAQAADQAKTQLLLCRKQVEDQVAAGLATLPANTDNLTREKTRTKLMDDAFAALAREKSACPSKAQGGDVGQFPRSDSMVEPFARAAFALKPYQMSDVVKTQYGYHLIMTTERHPGKEVKFEDAKEAVKEVYFERLRENLVGQLRQSAKIEIYQAKR